MTRDTDLLANIRSRPAESPLLIGRRGLAETYPENTIPAFEAAVAAGCEAVELDIRSTVDGHLVCSHDDDLWRCVNFKANPDVKGLRVSDMTLIEARRVDVGGWKGSRFAGLSMPTLEEALDVLLPGAIPVIERRGGTPGQLLEVLKKKNALGRAVVCDFDWDVLIDLGDRAPELALAANGKGPFDERNVRRLSRAGIPIVNWEYYGLTRKDAETILEAGLVLWTWTVNHEFEFQDSLSMGASGVISDRPGRLKVLRPV